MGRSRVGRRDQLMTEYRIATSVLENIVRGSLLSDRRLRVHSSLPLSRHQPVEVTVQGDRCSVIIRADARLGENLPSLAAQMRHSVADALTRMTGLTVSSVDVVFTGVLPTSA